MEDLDDMLLSIYSAAGDIQRAVLFATQKRNLSLDRRMDMAHAAARITRLLGELGNAKG